MRRLLPLRREGAAATPAKKITIEDARRRALRQDNCRLCPNDCRVARSRGETGICRAGATVEVASWCQHFGEERCLVGKHGSGTIFFSHCNLRCVYCQNFQISQHGIGRPASVEELSRMMLGLQALGCHNINLVTPTPWVAGIAEALLASRAAGLIIPAVYNCGGYESVATLKQLAGLIDIYMPDLKYGSNEAGEKYSGVKNYFAVAADALKEMHRQVGDLVIGKDGLARRGLLVRHLVLPGDAANTARCLELIKAHVSGKCAVNIMAQYRPCYRADQFAELRRGTTPREVRDARAQARRLALRILNSH